MLPSQLSLVFKDFLKKTTFLTLAIFLAYAIIIFLVPDKYISPAIPATIVFFLLLTISVFYFQIKISLQKTSRMVNFFMLATALKLLLFLVIVISYSLANNDDAANFIISFFIIYLAFSVFEVIQLLTLQEKINPKKQ